MLLVLFSACSVFQPLDGTWLFQFERESSASGDCADNDSGGGGGSTTYEGTNNMWVDAYTVSANQVVIVLGDPLIGTLEGNNVSVSYDTSYESGGVKDADSRRLEAALAGGTMEGTYTSESTWSGGGDSYRCTNTTDFTATRATSSPDAYAGT